MKEPNQTVEDNNKEFVAADDSLCRHASQILQPLIGQLLADAARLGQGKSSKKRIHRMRISTRQLRTITSNYKSCFEPRSYELIKAGLRGFSQEMASIRELDVFSKAMSKYLKKAFANEMLSGFAAIHQWVEDERHQHRVTLPANAEAFCNSDGFTLLRGFCADWQQSLANQQSPDEAPDPLTDFAALTIRQRVGEVLSGQACVEDAEPAEAFHQLRIMVKSLRYTLESLAAFHTEGFRTWLKVLVPIQDAMGDIHDRQMWMLLMNQAWVDGSLGGEADEASCKVIKSSMRLLERGWQREVEEAYHKFQLLWKYLARDGYWEGLLKECDGLQKPYSSEASQSPA